MRCRCLAASILILPALLGLAPRADDPQRADQVAVDFTTGAPLGSDFLTTGEGSGGEWVPGTAGLQARLPAGKADRVYLQLASRFGLKGDFEVVAAYTIGKLPTPTAQAPGKAEYEVSNNIQVSLPADDGTITLVYRNARRSGDGVGFYRRDPDGAPHSQHQGVTGTKGRLGLRRVGKDLIFLASGATDELVEVGRTEVGTNPIPRVALDVLPLNTDDALDVTFTRLDIRAEKILRTE